MEYCAKLTNNCFEICLQIEQKQFAIFNGSHGNVNFIVPHVQLHEYII